MNGILILNRFFHHPVTRIFVGVFSIVAAVILAQSGANTLLKHTPLTEDIKNLVVAVIAAAAALATYFYLFKFYEKRIIVELSSSRLGIHAVTGFITGFLILSLVILIMYLANAYVVVDVHPVSFLLPAFSLALSSAVFEELVFRGIIFRITETRLGSAWALAISSGIFGFGHLMNPNSNLFSAVAITIEAGLLLGAAYMYARNLWLPIFIHFAWNFSEGGVYGANISGSGLSKSLVSATIQGPDMLTGGSFGPENAVQAVMIGLLVSLLFLWKARKEHKWVHLSRKVKKQTEANNEG